MLFQPALLEGGAEERLSAGFGCRQPAAASLSAAGPVPESGASSQKWQAAGRQNAAFGQILGLRPPGSLVPPAAGPPCRQGSPEEPLRATAGKVRRSAKNSSQGRSFPFLSTLPARGATGRPDRARRDVPISIHAPREGSDRFPPPKVGKNVVIFLSTLPARGATAVPISITYSIVNFYPRSPRGERPMYHQASGVPAGFLSTLPARGATSSSTSIHRPKLFLSTLPARGATPDHRRFVYLRTISIHAPREGSDRCTSGRPPEKASFLSTLPARGATRGQVSGRWAC